MNTQDLENLNQIPSPVMTIIYYCRFSENITKNRRKQQQTTKKVIIQIENRKSKINQEIRGFSQNFFNRQNLCEAAWISISRLKCSDLKFPKFRAVDEFATTIKET